ncbi:MULTISPECIES: sensor histidine kinase [Halomicrobium]|uniref:histidine kinase n=2 Tax=Halomicrobium mukohataei TaxID=57705 RepID=C7P3F5_HALMD|nr:MULTISPECIES: ATP-binding protein [Halomicrobium]ACV47627.1 PAS/PAC sensor signal transduction histidine kinase [Halomicrobium mukohataei DSM 12286]QCD66085.1 histidine kinase [Halomicrobium mukohataei]QFR20890.1 PAS domain-containing protein [Halomicrobium sp. ZPS1]
MIIQLAGDLTYAGYLLVFAVATLACFVSIDRVQQLEEPGTRRGLTALLLASGGWALSYLGYFLVPDPQLKTAFYVAGLVVGLATVGAWLYFCSAFTGRTLHRSTGLRRAAVAIFLAIVAVKVTNYHGLYFATRTATEPFPHMAVTHEPLHWVVVGLCYALTAVGYFMLFERLRQVSYQTWSFGLLVGVTAVPLLLNLVGHATPLLADVSHEPLGVAVFAVGVSFVFHERFQAIGLAEGDDKPIVIVNERDQLREYNAAAADLFPALTRPDVIGKPLWSVVPSVAEVLDSESGVLSVRDGEETRYYQLTESPFAAGRSPVGRLVLFTDITERERDRRELQRQNERLEEFASVVSHDLRNPLQVLRGAFEGARETGDPSHFDRGERALDRMETLIDDVLSLARQGQPIDETEPISLASLAASCWEVIEAGDADLVVETDLDLVADPDRFRQLLENLFRNAVEHGGDDVTVRVGRLPDGNGFYLADDGPGIPVDEREAVFESGYSTTDGGTGFGLAIVSEIVDAHGWEITVSGRAADDAPDGHTDSESGSRTATGASFEITGIGSPDGVDASEAA